MYSFIVNPHARSGLGSVIWNQLDTILKEKNVAYEVYFTNYQKHATEIARQITSDGKEHTLIALGGDGTVNEVVNGISDYQKAILGYIPIGSSNDFARGLKIPKDPFKALELILEQPHLHPMDIGELRYKNRLRHFAVSCGLGFDADICHEAVVSRLKYILNKLKLGKLTYVGIALHRLILTKPCELTLTLDGTVKKTFPNTYFVAFMNNQYEGGGARFCPKAKNDDGKLGVIVASNISKLKVLFVIPFAFLGLHTVFKGVDIFSCEHVEVSAERPLPLHTDGEPIFLQQQISVCCASQKLRIITSRT